MTSERVPTNATPFQVQKAGLMGGNWVTVFRGNEASARKVFQRQLDLYSVGRFRLIAPTGEVLEDRKVQPKFSFN